jgi:hypothetical protein
MVGGIRQEGPASPAALTAIGNVLYFVADDGIHGMEPWIFTETTSSPARSPRPADASALYFAERTLRMIAPEQPVPSHPTLLSLPAVQTESQRAGQARFGGSSTGGVRRLSLRHVDTLFKSAWEEDAPAWFN